MIRVKNANRLLDDVINQRPDEVSVRENTHFEVRSLLENEQTDAYTQ